ncbi:hypothetical protein [Flavobacterium anhuiense]|uniref:hypothetical protein n=1 Tax=Flavobacterium anhuiense TaxID=459526 RepID=UPI0034D97C59
MAKQIVDQLDLIQTLLEDKFLEKGNNAKVLIEKNIMKRNIVINNGIKYLLYRYDPDKTKLFPYFSRTSGLHQICDYILFATEGKHLHLLLIELKLGTESATNQLIASECFIEFLLNSAKRIGINLTNNIHVKKIRVSEERAKKRNRKTKPGKLEFDQNGIINYDHSEVFRIKEVLDID